MYYCFYQRGERNICAIRQEQEWALIDLFCLPQGHCSAVQTTLRMVLPLLDKSLWLNQWNCLREYNKAQLNALLIWFAKCQIENQGEQHVAWNISKYVLHFLLLFVNIYIFFLYCKKISFVHNWAYSNNYLFFGTIIKLMLHMKKATHPLPE